MLRIGTSGRRKSGLTKGAAVAASAALAAMGLIAVIAGYPGSSHATVNGLEIKTLANRADLISGGSTLVQIVIPGGIAPSSVKVVLNGHDVTGEFAVRPNGLYEGLVTGLVNGSNVLKASATGAQSATIAIVNHPIGGPVFSGPQIQPWTCLPGAADAQCNRPVSFAFMYKQVTTGQFQPYDPSNPPPPADVASATTDQGMTVPYIVRVETGDQDRGQYKVAVLFTPGKSWQPWAPQKQWNGKTVAIGGAACGSFHGEPAAPNVLVDDPLGRGFLVWSTGLDNNGSDCNSVVQAESMTMAKEHIVDTYGTIRYTIGTGCSGGSIYQQTAANDYPGIFDGILPQCSFPDSWSTAVEVVDCRGLVDYFDHPDKWGNGVAWTADGEAAVEGHPPNICESWINVYGFDQGGNPREEMPDPTQPGTLDNTQNCGVPADKTYDPQSNPKGVRCDLADYMIDELGKRPQDGFANRPADNVGVQYGLAALLKGAITPAQFVDLNVKIGGRDIDYNPVPFRTAADPASLPVAYRGGLVNEGNNMHLPIIDLRGHDDIEIHHDYRSYVMRARLDRSNGTHANQVIWTGPLPLAADATFSSDELSAGTVDTANLPFPSQALTVMDQWLAAIEADRRDISYAQKVIADKPAAAVDECTDGAGNVITDQTVCLTLYPFFEEPRMVAGEPFTGDVIKCQLKPLSRASYFPVQFTDVQWAQLQQIFPGGVCDYGKTGVDQQPTIAWMSYAAGPGGMPLGPPPVSTNP